ncbi:MAG: ATP-binding cassette domain-containing protein [Ginsengibacter sp.]
MNIILENIGKRFNTEWIFRRLNYSFETGKRYAITGSNGSGKSTLLQIISGSGTHNEGKINFLENQQPILPENIYSKISLAAPYIELIEEMTLKEFITFHGKMKGWVKNFTCEEIIKTIHLSNATNKQIRYFSSGMKQRVKLGQAIFSNTPVILLDEPLTNLDEEGISLYHSLIYGYCTNRTVIVSSNDKKEYSFSDEILNIQNYK